MTEEATSKRAFKARRRLDAVGRANGSFGELLQGRLPNGDAVLVSLPIALESRVTLAPAETEPQRDPALWKTRAALERFLAARGVNPEGVSLTIDRDLPVGKGLGSSSADMVAAIRAAGRCAPPAATTGAISEILAAIEPHDPVHHGGCVAYDPVAGRLLKRLGAPPAFAVLGVDPGGAVETIGAERPADDVSAPLQALSAALARRDAPGVSAAATEAARRHAEAADKPALHWALAAFPRLGALGVVAAHTGPVAGLLFPPEADLSSASAETERVFGRAPIVTQTLTEPRR